MSPNVRAFIYWIVWHLLRNLVADIGTLNGSMFLVWLATVKIILQPDVKQAEICETLWRRRLDICSVLQHRWKGCLEPTKPTPLRARTASSISSTLHKSRPLEELVYCWQDMILSTTRQPLLFYLEVVVWWTTIGYTVIRHLGSRDHSLALYDIMYRQTISILLYIEVPCGGPRDGQQQPTMACFGNNI